MYLCRNFKVDIMKYIKDLHRLRVFRKKDVVSFIKDTDNEKMFIENFNKGIYQPELLFNDAEIISRVREHPLAVWKTRVRG